jgi:polysaccharide pyruvyl transferase WcaK-like protein
MNVWHFYARYYNFGDHALAVGLRNLFLKYFSKQLIFKTFNVHQEIFDKNLVNRLNGTADLLLIGGGGLIHGSKDKWLLQIPDQLIEKIRVPIICYGLGYNVFPGEKGITKSIVRNISLLQKKAVFFSVRNDGSKEKLLQFGIDAPEVPDPGFFVDCDYNAPPVKKPYTVIQLANDMKHNRGFNEDSLVIQITSIIKLLLEKNYSIVLAPHVRADIELADRIRKNFGNSNDIFQWDFFDFLRDEKIYRGLSFYKYADFVIAMRGHSQIFSIAMAVPVISLGSHYKNMELLEKLNVPKMYIPVNKNEFAKEIINCVSQIEKDRQEIQRKYMMVTSSLEKQAGDAIRSIVDDFQKKRREHLLWLEQSKKGLKNRLHKKIKKLKSLFPD